jgi:hypothetical protein
MILNRQDAHDQELITEYLMWEEICVSKHGFAPVDIDALITAGETREQFSRRIKKMKDLARTPHE